MTEDNAVLFGMLVSPRCMVPKIVANELLILGIHGCPGGTEVEETERQLLWRPN